MHGGENIEQLFINEMFWLRETVRKKSNRSRKRWVSIYLFCCCDANKSDLFALKCSMFSTELKAKTTKRVCIIEFFTTNEQNLIEISFAQNVILIVNLTVSNCSC